jgi:hypothetical protein
MSDNGLTVRKEVKMRSVFATALVIFSASLHAEIIGSDPPTGFVVGVGAIVNQGADVPPWYSTIPITIQGISYVPLSLTGFGGGIGWGNVEITSLTLYMSGHWHGEINGTIPFSVNSDDLEPVTIPFVGQLPFSLTLSADIPTETNVIKGIEFGALIENLNGMAGHCALLTRPDVEGIWLTQCDPIHNDGNVALAWSADAVPQASEPSILYLLLIVVGAISVQFISFGVRPQKLRT